MSDRLTAVGVVCVGSTKLAHGTAKYTSVLLYLLQVLHCDPKIRSPTYQTTCSSITVRVNIKIFCCNVRTTNVIQQVTVCA